MNEKRALIEAEEPKHKKKSKKKGQPRADHKHQYKTVLLINEYENRYRPGETSTIKRPTKVCAICGRVGETDMSMYEYIEMDNMPYRIHRRIIRDENSLEKWYVDDYFDKFAHKSEVLHEEI